MLARMGAESSDPLFFNGFDPQVDRQVFAVWPAKHWTKLVTISPPKRSEVQGHGPRQMLHIFDIYILVSFKLAECQVVGVERA